MNLPAKLAEIRNGGTLRSEVVDHLEDLLLGLCYYCGTQQDAPDREQPRCRRCGGWLLEEKYL